jgi:hypothetical protein
LKGISCYVKPWDGMSILSCQRGGTGWVVFSLWGCSWDIAASLSH